MQASTPHVQEARRSLLPEGWEGSAGDVENVDVDVRQQHAILRRRRQWAKVEAENKALRVRKVTRCFFALSCLMD